MKHDKDFGQWLVKEGLLQREGLQRALSVHESTNSRLDTVLLDSGLITEGSLLEALGRFHNTRTVSKVELRATGPALARTLSPRIAVRLRVVPFRLEGKTLSVATLEPGDLLMEDELSLVSGCMIATFVTLEVRLIEALSRLYDLLLPGQYEALISRLEQESAPQRSHAVEALREPVETRSETVAPEQHVPHALRRRRPEHVDPVDLSQEDLHLFPSLRAHVEGGEARLPAVAGGPRFEPPAADLGPEDRLAATSLALQNSEMREDIADAVLGHCAPLFRRRMMLVVRGSEVLGWRGEGEGIRSAAVRSVSIPAAEPSVFLGLLQGADFWLGPLPEMAHNRRLVTGLGGVAPSECFILPVRLRDKTVCFLYFDNLEEGVSGLPMAELKRLAAKVSLAFQVYLMKSKIRNV
jgi:hypothetical protein